MTTNNSNKKNDRRKSWLVPTSSLFNSIFYPKQQRSHNNNNRKQRALSLDQGSMKKMTDTTNYLTISTTLQQADIPTMEISPSTPTSSSTCCCTTTTTTIIDKKKKTKKSSISSSIVSKKAPKLVEAIFSKAKKHPKLKRAATLIEVKAQHYLKPKEGEENENDDHHHSNTINDSLLSSTNNKEEKEKEDDLFNFNLPFNIGVAHEQDFDKLQLKNDLIKLAFAGEFNRPFNEDTIEKVIDIGCGPNLPWSIDFAKEHPNAHVIGMDLLDPINELMDMMPKNCELLKHNCIKPFPIEAQSIDLIHIRTMNTSFTMEQYKKVIENCWQVLKPGGHIEIMEMDTLVYSTGPVTEVLNQQVIDKLRYLGFEPRLAKMLKEVLPLDPQLTDQHITEFYRSLPIGVWGGRLGVLFRDDLIYSLTFSRHIASSFSTPPPPSLPQHPHSLSRSTSVSSSLSNHKDIINTPPPLSITTTVDHQYHQPMNDASSSTTITPTNSILFDQHQHRESTSSELAEEDEDILFENQLLIAEKELEQCRSFSNFHFLRVQKP
ncbi:unnamed protein product [Cunninghamella blakesleeana]